MPSNNSRKSMSSYSEPYIQQIFENLPDPIFLTDAEGNVLLSNSTTAFTLDMSLSQLIQSNLKDLVEKGYYSFSYALEVPKTKKEAKGEIKTKLGMTIYTKSTPILDEDGNVIFIVTYGKKKDKEVNFGQADISEQQKREIDYLRSYVFNEESIIAESKAMKKTLLMAHTVAQTDGSVLICGESGTGKEVLAKYIHRRSKRADGPFIAVNCAALPENLVESELFGYEKGAFTGASNKGKIGLFEAANGGTLFLDEIAELPLDQQAKLLRVLETKVVRRIGGNKEYRTDFRLLTATNKDLKKMVSEGDFRHDLYFRINIVKIDIPPLRERPEDTLAMAQHFIELLNKKYGCDYKLDNKTMNFLQQYDWPGNIRELRNFIESTIITNLSKYSDSALSLIQQSSQKRFNKDCFDIMGIEGTLKEVTANIEKLYITHVLEKNNGKKSKTAEMLGIHRTVLYRKMKDYNIEI